MKQKNAITFNMKKPINLFIVDDNRVFSLALKADIEAVFDIVSLKIHLFETGEKCMEHFKRELPELVILDYHLNTKVRGAADGLEILEQIKKNKVTNVIMLTGEDNLDIAVKSLQHGASDYVVKTETKFKKINYSLLNLFKIMDAKEYERKYKQSIVGFCVCFALMVVMAISILVYNYVSLN